MTQLPLAVAPVRRVAQHCDVTDRDVQHDAASPASQREKTGAIPTQPVDG